MDNGHAKNPYAKYYPHKKGEANFDYTTYNTTCFKKMVELESIVATSDGNIRIGTAFTDLGKTYSYEPMYKVYGPSRHLTLLFNLFVWL